MRKPPFGPSRFIAPALFAFMLAQPASAQDPAAGVPAAVTACRDKVGGEQFPYHRCLIDAYEAEERATDALAEEILTIIGGHHVSGISGWSHRRNWSAAILMGQSAWKKFVLADCEWPGHFEQGRQEASAAGKGNKVDAGAVMIECRVSRALERKRELEARLQALRGLYPAASKE